MEREGGIKFSGIQRFNKFTSLIAFLRSLLVGSSIRKRWHRKKLVKIQETEEHQRDSWMILKCMSDHHVDTDMGTGCPGGGRAADGL